MGARKLSGLSGELQYRGQTIGRLVDIALTIENDISNPPVEQSTSVEYEIPPYQARFFALMQKPRKVAQWKRETRGRGRR